MPGYCRIAGGNFSDGAGGAAAGYADVDAGYYGTQYFMVVMGMDANGNGALDSDEIMLASNIEAVDLHGLTANGQSGGLTLYAGSNGSATVNVNALINPGDSAGDSWIKYWVDPSNASPSSGDFGSGSQNITFTPGTYSVDAGFDWSQEQAVSVTVVAPPMLTALVLSDTHSGGPSITVGTDSGSDSILYLNLPDTGTAGFNIATSVTGTMLSPAVVRWKIDGETATPDSGTNGGTVSVDGSSSGNWTYAVTAWVDMNNNGQIDNGESELQGTVTVVDPVFTLTDEVSGQSRENPGDGSILPVTKSDDNSEIMLSLDNALPSGALPPRYTFEVVGAGDTDVASGSFDGDAIDVPTPAPGFYSVLIRDTQDENFVRYLTFDVVQLRILWDGDTMIGVGLAVEVVPQQVLTDDSSINLLAGQNMVLNYDLLQGSPITVTSVQWNVGSPGDFVKSYTLNGPARAPTSDTVVMLAAGDLTANSISGYCVVDSPGRPIDLTITAAIDGVGTLVFNTSTTINFQKPGQSIWSGPSIPNYPNFFTVTGSFTPLAMVGNELTPGGTQVQWNTMVPSIAAGYVGEICYVQLLNWYAHESGDGLSHTSTSNGQYWLDTQYPYSSSLAEGDGPSASAWYASSLSLICVAQDWLMWTPPGTASIPVPIQSFDWQETGSADWISGIGWLLSAMNYPSWDDNMSIVGTNTSTYPQWSGVLEVN